MTATMAPTIETTTPHWRGINHLADEDALIDLQHRLKNADCKVTDVIDHGN